MAKRLGAPADIVRDRGHAAGMRMRDYGGFGDPQGDKTALLIETGQHWRASSVAVAKDVAHRFLAETGVVEAADLPADWKQPAPASQRVVQVTHAIATKRGNFTPARRFEGQEVIAKARHRAGPRRRRAGDDALRRLRAGDARGQPAAARRRHGCSSGSADLRPGWRRITKRSSDSRTIPSSAPSAA